MQTAQNISINPHVTPGSTSTGQTPAEIVARGDYRVIRRNGAVVAFEPTKISDRKSVV